MIEINPRQSKRNQFNDDDLVCYCFIHTKRDIENDYLKNNRSLIRLFNEFDFYSRCQTAKTFRKAYSADAKATRLIDNISMVILIYLSMPHKWREYE